jgi:ribosomal protein S18 acetylase RimI-like enzyme
VARGQERIRFRVRLDHPEEDLLRAANVVGSVHRRLVRNESRVKCSQSDRFGGFHAVVVDQPSPEQVEELCDASIRQAQQRNTPLPWVSRKFIAKYFARSSYWSETASSRTWHLGYRFGKLVTAFQVDRTPVSVGGTMVRAALLGSLICEADCEDLMQQQICDALQQLGPEVECGVAPASYPVQVFGCGMQAWRGTDGKPFLETSYADELLGIWEGAGFRRAGSKCYRRIELSSEVKPVGGLGNFATVRDFRRAEFVAEIDRIAPILEQTLGGLDLCAPVPKTILQGLIQDLRELVLPGLWLVAEHGQQTVGFAFCYPNVTAEFERIQGNADVADFQLIQQAMETSSEAFLAWLAVDPAYAEQGVAERLLNELRGRLETRGCSHVWMSWEIVDGNRSLEQLAQSLGHVVRVAEMPYFMTPLGTRHAPRSIVPEPHFSARAAHGPAADEPPMSSSDLDSPLSR